MAHICNANGCTRDATRGKPFCSTDMGYLNSGKKPVPVCQYFFKYMDVTGTYVITHKDDADRVIAEYPKNGINEAVAAAKSGVFVANNGGGDTMMGDDESSGGESSAAVAAPQRQQVVVLPPPPKPASSGMTGDTRGTTSGGGKETVTLSPSAIQGILKNPKSKTSQRLAALLSNFGGGCISIDNCNTRVVGDGLEESSLAFVVLLVLDFFGFQDDDGTFNYKRLLKDFKLAIEKKGKDGYKLACYMFRALVKDWVTTEVKTLYPKCDDVDKKVKLVLDFLERCRNGAIVDADTMKLYRTGHPYVADVKWTTLIEKVLNNHEDDGDDADNDTLAAKVKQMSIK